jgi:hypothetical protein
MIQAVACNRLHTTEERCCRWVLSVHDRLGRARFELKVRFLARAVVADPKSVPAPQTAKVLPIRGAGGGCTLCGSTTRVPHRNGHECILALDEEIAALVQRTHTLRKYRAQLTRA